MPRRVSAWRARGVTSSAGGVGTVLEDVADDVLAADPLHPQLRPQREAVRERRDGDGLHVLRRDEVAPRERRPPARELQQRERAARAGADLDARALARRGDDVDDVAADRLGDVDALDGALHARGASVRRRPARARPRPRRAARARSSIAPLVLAARVADAEPQQEPVELRLGQRIRALVLDRVLRREHDERPLERAGRLALDRDLPLLHRLEQRGLRLRRRAVDLVGEQEVREDRPRPELELARALVEDRRAGDVRRHEVRRELDAREVELVACAKERAASVLARPGKSSIRRLKSSSDVALADDRALDLVEDAGRRGRRPRSSVRSSQAARAYRVAASARAEGPGAERSSGGSRSAGRRSASSSPRSSRAGLPPSSRAAPALEPVRRSRRRSGRRRMRSKAFAAARTTSRSSRSSSAGRVARRRRRTQRALVARTCAGRRAARGSRARARIRSGADEEDVPVERDRARRADHDDGGPDHRPRRRPPARGQASPPPARPPGGRPGPPPAPRWPRPSSSGRWRGG